MLINEIPDAVEPGLLHLCEFIEDCEFTYLSTQILHVLGRKGPKTAHPGRYIRHIYNRIILENATVRSAAVTSLAKFGAQVPSLRGNITTLLRRCETTIPADSVTGVLLVSHSQTCASLCFMVRWR